MKHICILYFLIIESLLGQQGPMIEVRANLLPLPQGGLFHCRPLLLLILIAVRLGPLGPIQEGIGLGSMVALITPAAATTLLSTVVL